MYFKTPKRLTPSETSTAYIEYANDPTISAMSPSGDIFLAGFAAGMKYGRQHKNIRVEWRLEGHTTWSHSDVDDAEAAGALQRHLKEAACTLGVGIEFA